MWKFSLDFRKKSCSISKNILSKVILKYQVSMSTCTSVYPAIMRTVNPLSQLYISRKLQKYISVSICHCYRASFTRTLFIAFKNDEWCHFVVRIGSPALILFYCVCVFSFYFSLFFSFLFVEHTTC